MIEDPGLLLGLFSGSLFGPVLAPFWKPLGAFWSPLGKPFGVIWVALGFISGRLCGFQRVPKIIKRPEPKWCPGLRTKMALQIPKRPPETGDIRHFVWKPELSFRLRSASNAPAWCLRKVRARAIPGKNLSARVVLGIYIYIYIY